MAKKNKYRGTPKKTGRRGFVIGSTAVLSAGALTWALWPESTKKKEEVIPELYLAGRIINYSPAISKFFTDYLDPEIIYKLEDWNSLIKASEVATQMIDESHSIDDTKKYLNKCISYIFTVDRNGNRLPNNKILWGGKRFQELPPHGKLEVISSVLFNDIKISYEHDASKAEPYLFPNLLKNNMGNCATMPLLYAMLAEKCYMPVSLSYVGNHMFARYDDRLDTLPEPLNSINPFSYEKHQKPYEGSLNKPGYINIECTNNKSSGVASFSDQQYYMKENSFLAKEGKSPIPFNLVQYGAYLRTLTKAEAMGAFFANQAHYAMQKGMDKKEVMKFLAYAFYLNNRDYGMIQNIMSLIPQISTVKEKPYYEQLYKDLINHINVMFKGNFRTISRAQKKRMLERQREELADPAYHAKELMKKQQKEIDEIIRRNLERERKQQSF